MAGRSSLSNNWRMKSDALPQDHKPMAESSRDLAGWGPQQRTSLKMEEKHSRTHEDEASKIRREDDPRTL